MSMHLKVGLICLALLSLSVMTALAHQPLFPRPDQATAISPLLITEPWISWAIYAELRDPGQIDYYYFEVKAGDPIYLQMAIPKIADLADFTPSFALIGPGLPTAPSGIPVAPGSEDGALIFADLGTPAEFYEPFTGTRYWHRQETEIDAPATSVYRVIVWSPGRQIGKYVLAVGTREKWGLRDLFRFFSIRRQVRQWFAS